MIDFTQTPEQVLKTLETCDNDRACVCLIIARHNVFDNDAWSIVIAKAQKNFARNGKSKQKNVKWKLVTLSSG